jgi:NADH-quinone oxidoreductase subunit L
MNEFLAVSLLVPPLLVLTLLSLAWWFGRPLGEDLTTSLVGVAFILTAAQSFTLLARNFTYLAEPGVWFSVGGYASVWEFSADPLALIFASLTAVLLFVIAVFSKDYLHQETGYFRFYLLLTLFGMGVLLVTLAGNLEQVFLGWELVGLTSALLIAFFNHRPGPAGNGFRAFLTYRLCDVGLLGAVVWLHHTVGSTSFQPLETGGPARFGLIAPDQATVIGLLLLVACLGKSALFPVGGWLPRAMEGPTPSSAVFYGALSVHLGPYLLLRARPLYETSTIACAAVVAVGLLTAVHGSIVGRVQSDIKGALAYGSMTQVGLIVAEVGLGLEWFALLHIVGHACVRTLEILRAPSVLHEYHHLELSLGSVLPRMGNNYEKLLPAKLRHRLYLHALCEGPLEPVPFYFFKFWKRFWLGLDRWERRLEELFGSSGSPNNSLEVLK